MVHLSGCTEVHPHGEVPGFNDVFADGGHGSFLVCLHGVANSSELRFRLFFLVFVLAKTIVCAA